MKRVLLLSVAVLFVASLAWGQPVGGRIGIFVDAPSYSDCNLVESVGGPNLVYVVHYAKSQSNTSQFKVLDNWGAFDAGTNVGGNLFIASGPANSIYEGGTVTYVGCKPLPHLLVTLTIIPFAASGPCGGTLDIVADPVLPSGQIETVNCDGSTVEFAEGDRLSVNDDGSGCVCGPIIGTEETSWSRIKAMYK